MLDKIYETGETLAFYCVVFVVARIVIVWPVWWMNGILIPGIACVLGISGVFLMALVRILRWLEVTDT